VARPDRSLATLFSRACLEVGATREITSAEEDSTEARACRIVFPEARDRVLSSAPWRFATKRLALALATESKPPSSAEWAYHYGYPDDCLVARFLADGRKTRRPDQRIPWRRESTGILTDQAEAVLVYTYRHEGIALWPAPVVEALMYLVASGIAPGLAKKREIRGDCLQLHMLSLSKAKTPDLLEEEEPPDDSSSFMEARR
jgi:hypothetical protein